MDEMAEASGRRRWETWRQEEWQLQRWQ